MSERASARLGTRLLRSPFSPDEHDPGIGSPSLAQRGQPPRTLRKPQARRLELAVECLFDWNVSGANRVSNEGRVCAGSRAASCVPRAATSRGGKMERHHDAGKLSEAWALYQRVWKHQKTYDVPTSLGGVCYRRGEYAAATHYYRIALDEMVPTESPKFVEELKGAFDAARAEVIELKLSVVPVNGKPPEPLTITDERSNWRLEAPYYLETWRAEPQSNSAGVRAHHAPGCC